MQLLLLLVAAVTAFMFTLLVDFSRGDKKSNKFALLGSYSDGFRCARRVTKAKCGFGGFARAVECELPVCAYAAIKNRKPFRRVFSWRASQAHARWIHQTLANWATWPGPISQYVSHIPHFYRTKNTSVNRRRSGNQNGGRAQRGQSSWHMVLLESKSGDPTANVHSNSWPRGMC
jgi:hypothetical protein